MPLSAGTKLGLHEQLFGANRTAWSSSTLVIRNGGVPRNALLAFGAE
jgi:hypothetical protein